MESKMSYKYHSNVFGVILLGALLCNPSVPFSQTKIKVFILAGQSNMEGQGEMTSGAKGNLKYLWTNNKPVYGHLADASGAWVVRNDVWIYFAGGGQGTKKGNLTTGYGGAATTIGPELQFGHLMGNYFNEQVLIIKTAWGGKSLAVDFRPPSSGGTVGPYYTQMVSIVKDVLANIKTNFPSYAGQGYEIAGFGWHQGWNDGGSTAMANEYEKNMVNFIKDVRTAFNVPAMPFIIANSGFNGYTTTSDTWQKNIQTIILPGQNAVPGHTELNGKVFTVETRPFWRVIADSPSDQVYHWNRNAESYFLIGDGLAKEMIKFIPNTVGHRMTPVKNRRPLDFFSEISGSYSILGRRSQIPLRF